MSDFCTKCLEKEAELEILRKKHYDEVQSLKEQIVKLTSDNEALSFDLAFYEGRITNLSCNNK